MFSVIIYLFYLLGGGSNSKYASSDNKSHLMAIQWAVPSLKIDPFFAFFLKTK